MNLVERYVQAVKSYLPKKMRDDVGEELGLLLNEKLDDLREESGSDISEALVCEILKQQGHPMKVAASYQEPSALVSETLFPIYRQALTWILGIITTVHVFSWATGTIYDYETQSLKALIFATVNSLIAGFAYATLAFHFGGKLLEKQKIFTRWNPLSLPALRTDWQTMSRSDSIPSLIGNLLLLAILNGLSPFQHENVSLQASAEFAALLPWANGILLFSLAYDIEKIFRPLHTRVTTIFALVLAAATLILLGYILFLDSSVELRLGEHVFHPLKPYILIIAIFVIFLLEGLPNIKRLLRMI